MVAGAEGWLSALPETVADLERDWAIRVGATLSGGTEAFVAEALLDDGARAVLKLPVPREGDDARNEITVLRLANGQGCARLLRDDVERGALLIERLGPSMFDLGVPFARREVLLCDVALQVWRPAPDSGLPTGACKGRWLIDSITTRWEELGRPCRERTVEHAIISRAFK